MNDAVAPSHTPLLPSSSGNEGVTREKAELARAQECISSLLIISRKISPEFRVELDRLRHPLARFADLTVQMQDAATSGPLEEFRFLSARTELDVPSVQLPSSVRHLQIHAASERMELYRQRLLSEERTVHAMYEKVAEDVTIEALNLAISILSSAPFSKGEQSAKDNGIVNPFMLPEAVSPQNTRLLHALVALRHQKVRDAKEANGRKDEVDFLRRETRRYVLAALNPPSRVEYMDVTDVKGNQRGVSGANDNTHNRVDQARKELARRFGIDQIQPESVNIFDQGTSISCPEQCGFAALVAINQARRVAAPRMINPRFIVLNNAARTANQDNIVEGAEKSRSSAMLYFTFDLGDGVLHRGLSYGHQTLTHLRPYIRDLYEVDDTSEGSQFRSLDIQQADAFLSVLGDRAFPAHRTGKKLPLDEIPQLNLASNQAQFLGYDEFGNGVTSIPAEKIFLQFLKTEQNATEVAVTIFDRQGKKIIRRKIYTLARALGVKRSGNYGLWESSTPRPDNPLSGYLSIGRFMKTPGQLNQDVLEIPPGSIIQIDPANHPLDTFRKWLQRMVN